MAGSRSKYPITKNNQCYKNAVPYFIEADETATGEKNDESAAHAEPKTRSPESPLVELVELDAEGGMHIHLSSDAARLFKELAFAIMDAETLPTTDNHEEN
ncbi:hypothetical protein JKG47_08390 [Acidithiobacillus sp. MC6.1]|nr:hypothetical protein [Acidithiobacillus sp. MC6.1]